MHYVEAALADAVAKAAAAGQFEVVAQLAREIEARRAAREATGAKVVKLSDRRRR